MGSWGWAVRARPQLFCWELLLLALACEYPFVVKVPRAILGWCRPAATGFAFCEWEGTGAPYSVACCGPIHASCACCSDHLPCRRLDANAISSQDRSTLEAAVLVGRAGGTPGHLPAQGGQHAEQPAAAQQQHQAEQRHGPQVQQQARQAGGEDGSNVGPGGSLVSPVNELTLTSPGTGELRLAGPGGGAGGGGILGGGPGSDMMALPSDLQVWLCVGGVFVGGQAGGRERKPAGILCCCLHCARSREGHTCRVDCGRALVVYREARCKGRCAHSRRSQVLPLVTNCMYLPLLQGIFANDDPIMTALLDAK